MNRPPGSKALRGSKAAKRRNKKGGRPAGLASSLSPKGSAPDKAHSVSYPSDGVGEASDSEDEGTDGYRKGGYHPVKVGEKFNRDRYTVLRKLGWGHFSTVWLVYDHYTGGQAALKVQKSAQHYTDAARDEIKLLSMIRQGDEADDYNCVRLLDCFDHIGPHGRHVCLVFEVLGDNLLALIKHYDYRGIPLDVLRQMSGQILEALDYMHTRCQIIHTDLKPENVMLTEAIRPQRAALVAAARAGELTEACLPPSSSSGSGKIAEAIAAGLPLTRNQKKKLKRKQRKAGADAGLDATSSSEHLCDGTSPSRDEATSAGPADSKSSADKADLDGPSTDGHCPASASEEDADALKVRLLRARYKIVDFGNACWTYKQFTDDIQTRQYRCPEVLLGAKYSTPADMWSLACMIFELATGDLLFDPRSGRDYDRDEDHLALFIELLGKMPKKISGNGSFSKDFFNRHGELRHIKSLRFWPLDKVLTEKYNMPEAEAVALSSFLLPMLEYVPEQRATAAQMQQHPWLTGKLPSLSSQAGDRHRSAPSSSSPRLVKRSRSPSPSPPQHEARTQTQASGAGLPSPQKDIPALQAKARPVSSSSQASSFTQQLPSGSCPSSPHMSSGTSSRRAPGLHIDPERLSMSGELLAKPESGYSTGFSTPVAVVPASRPSSAGGDPDWQLL
ncbi:hypothetical protein WJX84_008536 [Apatococcus fuscideae]|uniref:non-specific serine/threonine protein kinase n=1 Tax=Apatococcus fuscideae TaxID=2026836 RepID=A0AAW1SP07_9CHLO